MEAKERIAKKANDLFMQYGIRSVSMDDISSQVGMSKKTLYQCFADKEDLVNEVICTIMDHNREECICDKKKAENAVHELFLAFDMISELFANMNPAVMFDLQKYHPTVFKKIQEYKYGFLFTVIRENLERGIKEELYRPEINVEILTRFRIESTMLAFNSEIFPTNRTELVKIEQEILDHFLYGVANAKGQKLILKYKRQRQKS